MAALDLTRRTMETTHEDAAQLAVAVVSGRAAFMALQPEWDALVGASRDEVFYRHEFFRAWLDNFAPRRALRVLTARDAGGRLRAVLPLLYGWGRLSGVPLRLLSGAANDHSCRFDLIGADPAAAAAAFLAHLARDRSWDVLLLPDVPEGGNGWQLYHAAQRRGYPAGSWVSLESPYVPLPASYDALQAGLQTKFKANLRRRRKKLEEKGAVTFERVATAEDLEARLAEGYALEQSGWKGRGGTAIAQDAATQGFYSDLAASAAAGDYLSLYFLRLAGRPVAFHYGLSYGDRYLLLKPAYDEELKECSPGQLLLDEVLRDCIARGLTEFDFLGPNMVWKQDWTDKIRPHTWLYVFRPTPRGRMLRAWRFDVLPALKSRVKRWLR